MPEKSTYADNKQRGHLCDIVSNLHEKVKMFER